MGLFLLRKESTVISMSFNENKDGWFAEGIHIFPNPLETLKKLGHFLCDHIRYETPSEHHGAAQLLDHELYDKTVIHTHINGDTVTRTVLGE